MDINTKKWKQKLSVFLIVSMIMQTAGVTALAEEGSLVEEASSSKAPIAKMADKIAGVFVPVVMGIAAAAFLIWIISGATFEFALSIGA